MADTPYKDPRQLGTFGKFSGVNNVLPEQRVPMDGLVQAVNCDLDNSGELRAALGTTLLAAGDWHSAYGDTDGNRFAVKDGDLVRFAADGSSAVIQASVGAAKMYFYTLPDGNTVYMNGTVAGTVLSGTNTVRTCGVPIPVSAGSAADTAGSMFPGDYGWQVAYKRDSDGQEGGMQYPVAGVTVTTGGIALTGLPQLAGHTLQIYISSHNDDTAYWAGQTAGTTFTFTAANDTLVLPSKTDFLAPPPVGTHLGFYRGRMLVADGPVLWASRPFQYELFDLRKDYKMFKSDILFHASVDDGVYVGTADGVFFLQGDQFDKLTMRTVDTAPALANSAVVVDGAYIGEGQSSGKSVICVAGGYICAGAGGGNWQRLTDGVFKVPETTCTGAAFHYTRGIPQYVVHVS